MATRVTDTDVQAAFDALRTTWTEYGAPADYELIRVSGTATRDHWAIGRRTGSISTLLTGFTNLGANREAARTLYAATVSARIAGNHARTSTYA